MGHWRERLWWRISALFGGICFLFVGFSPTALAGQLKIGEGSVWLAEEWTAYFRRGAPGDLLVEIPILIAGVSAPFVPFLKPRGIESPEAICR